MAVDMFKLSQAFSSIAETECVGDDWIRFKEAVDTVSFLFWAHMQDHIDWLDAYILDVEGVKIMPNIYEEAVSGIRLCK